MLIMFKSLLAVRVDLAKLAIAISDFSAATFGNSIRSKKQRKKTLKFDRSIIIIYALNLGIGGRRVFFAGH